MLSKKFKAKLKRIAFNTTLTVSAVVMLFVMGVSLDGRGNTVLEQSQSEDTQEAKAGNEITVVKDSTGINLKINVENSTVINKVEVYQGTDKIKEYTYTDGQTNKTENLVISIPFGETHTITVKANGNLDAGDWMQPIAFALGDKYPKGTCQPSLCHQ